MTNQQTQLFWHIFLVLKIGTLKVFKKINADTSLPLKYGDFRLHKILKNFPCGIGIYEDGKEKKVLIKIWRGSIRTYEYYQLIKEIRLYELLHGALDRIRTEMDPRYQQVHIPRLLEKNILPHEITVVFEYVNDCIHLKDVSSFSEKSRIHDLAVDFWTYVGDRLTTEEKEIIPRRTLTDTFVIYGIVLTYAMLRYPGRIPSLIRTLPIVFRGAPALVKNWREGLIHRDFHFENILVNDRGVTIIDFGDNALTHPLQVFTNSLHWEWNNPESRNVILKSIASSYGKSRETDNIFRALFAMSAVQLLHDTGSKKRLALNFQCFDAVINDWNSISAILSGKN